MKSLPNIDYHRLTGKIITAQEKPIGKYGNIKNYLRERGGADIDDATLDKKMRTFFEDLITEILKNPTQWDRTRNINFMELMNYLEGTGEQEVEQMEQPAQPEQKVSG
jgi:hypothetical protein